MVSEHLRKLLPGVFGLVLVACAGGCAGVMGDGDDEENVTTSAAGLTNDELETKIQEEINRRRVARGLQRLSLGGCVDGFAERWAGHLASIGRFEHQEVGPIVRDCNGLWAAENLAGGSASITASQWVTLWMNSPSHRDIVLRPRADRVGVGVRKRPNGDVVISAVFIDKPNE